MRRKGSGGARIACFQLGKRLQITLRGGIIKFFGSKRFEGTKRLRSASEQQIPNGPTMEILHGLCQRCTDTDASTKLFVGGFEPRSNVDCIAIGGVIEETDAAEIPDKRQSGMRANPESHPARFHFCGNVRGMTGPSHLVPRRTSLPGPHGRAVHLALQTVRAKHRRRSWRRCHRGQTRYRSCPRDTR